MPLLACPAVFSRGFLHSLLDKPAVAPFFNRLLIVGMIAVPHRQSATNVGAADELPRTTRPHQTTAPIPRWIVEGGLLFAFSPGISQQANESGGQQSQRGRLGNGLDDVDLLVEPAVDQPRRAPAGEMTNMKCR